MAERCSGQSGPGPGNPIGGARINGVNSWLSPEGLDASKFLCTDDARARINGWWIAHVPTRPHSAPGEPSRPSPRINAATPVLCHDCRTGIRMQSKTAKALCDRCLRQAAVVGSRRTVGPAADAKTPDRSRGRRRANGSGPAVAKPGSTLLDCLLVIIPRTSQ